MGILADIVGRGMAIDSVGETFEVGVVTNTVNETVRGGVLYNQFGGIIGEGG